MRKALVSSMAIFLGLGMIAGNGFSGGRTDDPLGVSVSPQTLLLGATQAAVTAHTDIPYGSVDRTRPVTLNGVESVSLFADSQGNLVAKFSEAAIKAIVAPPSAVMTLAGTRKDGTSFVGSDTVKVMIYSSPGE